MTPSPLDPLVTFAASCKRTADHHLTRIQGSVKIQVLLFLFSIAGLITINYFFSGNQ